MTKMFDNRGLLLMFDREKDQYIVSTPSGTSHKYANPLEAWTEYINRLDIMVRKQIGDMLAANGKNRYTGEPDITFCKNKGVQ